MVLGGNANDTIKVYQGPWDDGYCTSGLTPGVIHGGRFLDLAGLGGDDFIRGGDGDTWLFGDDGNDRLIFYSSIGQLHGQAGDDKLHSLGISATGESLFGGPGNDCFQDANDQSATFDGGDGPGDAFMGSPPNRINFEYWTNTCS
jgi:Ca2+-binding RTX toxin-like protein